MKNNEIAQMYQKIANLRKFSEIMNSKTQNAILKAKPQSE